MNTDAIRKAMVETGQPQADLADVTGHEAVPAPGSIRGAAGEIVTNGVIMADGATRPGLATPGCEIPFPLHAECTSCGQWITVQDSEWTWRHQTWTTAELTADFEVIGFAAPFVVARRRADGAKGSLEFTHSPRVYFGWKEDKS